MRDTIDSQSEKSAVQTLSIQTVSRLNPQCVVLTWKPIENCECYRVQRLDAYGQYRELATTNSPFFYDWTAVQGESYQYRVLSQDGWYIGEQSEGYCQKNTTSIAILMYHYVASEEDFVHGVINNSGTVSLQEFENDLRFLSEHQIETITCHQLIQFINGEIDLPNRCVMISFDDGHYSVWKHVYPLLQKYHCQATVSVIGAFADLGNARTEIPQSNYWMTWDEIQQVHEESSNEEYIEFGSHSYDLHQDNAMTGRHGSRNLPDESYEEYQAFLVADELKMRAQWDTIGIIPSFFVFPYNDPSGWAKEIYSNQFDYHFLMVGDSDYFVPTKANCFLQGIGEQALENKLLRRLARHAGDDIEVLLNQIWNDEGTQN